MRSQCFYCVTWGKFMNAIYVQKWTTCMLYLIGVLDYQLAGFNLGFGYALALCLPAFVHYEPSAVEYYRSPSLNYYRVSIQFYAFIVSGASIDLF